MFMIACFCGLCFLDKLAGFVSPAKVLLVASVATDLRLSKYSQLPTDVANRMLHICVSPDSKLLLYICHNLQQSADVFKILFPTGVPSAFTRYAWLHGPVYIDLNGLSTQGRGDSCSCLDIYDTPGRHTDVRVGVHKHLKCMSDEAVKNAYQVVHAALQKL